MLNGASPSNNTISLWWPVVEGANSYQVYRHTVNSENGRTLLTDSAINAPKYDDSDNTLDAATPYFYWVKACDGENCSNFSDAVEVALANGMDKPYAVITVAQLQAIGAAAPSDTLTDRLAGRYALARDIDLSDIANWTPIGDGTDNTNRFTGSFDGQGFEISGLNSSGHQYAGLFGYMEGASISNIGVLVGTVSASSDSHAGGLVGRANSSSISNSYAIVTGDISASGASSSRAGGLVGVAEENSPIRNSYAIVTGNISSSTSSTSSVSNAGGLVGSAFSNSPISNSYAEVTGNISASSSGDFSFSNAGGLVGEADDSDISNSYAIVTGDISSSSDDSYAGGLVGSADGSPISNSYAVVEGNISSSSGTSYAGGLVGSADGSPISNSYAVVSGDISSSSSFAGGLVGEADNSSVSNSYAIVSGAISSTGTSFSDAGGLVGFANNSSISNSYAIVTGNISSSSGDSYAGGLVGEAFNNSPISNSYAIVTGNISTSGTGDSYAGGLVGEADDSSISNSYAIVTGDISSSSSDDSYAGGLVGDAENSPVSNSYYSARRKAGEGAFRNTEGATFKTVAELKAPTGLSDIYESWTAFYDASENYALDTGTSANLENNDRRVWYFGDDAQLPTLNPSPVAVSNTDLPLHRASQHFVATVSGATQVDLSWSDAGTAANPITYYEVYRHTANDNSIAEAAGPIARPMVSSVTGRTYMNTGLTTNTTYYYWLKACQGEGVTASCSDFFAHAQATPKEPPALVSMVNGASPSNNTISLWWPVVEGANSYQVYRHTVNSENGRTLLTNPAINAPKYDDSDNTLDTATPYYYWVKACEGENCSDFSAAVEVALANGMDKPYAVITVAQLQAIGAAAPSDTLTDRLAGRYALARDIDLSDIANWTPIGDRTNKFTGSFDGQGFEISGLNSSGHQYAGLFGYVEDASLSNIGVLVGTVSASSDSHAGGLVGHANSSSISNSYAIVTGDISASGASSSRTGGLVGVAEENSPIRNSYAIVTGNISSSTSSTSSVSNAGGLVGSAFSNSPISNSYAEVTGNISASSTSTSSFSNAGGLVGLAQSNSPIRNSYAIVTGDISSSGTSASNAGGLVGEASNSPVSNSYYSASRKVGEGAFRNTDGATPKTVAELKAPTDGIYDNWTAFYDADSMPAHALITNGMDADGETVSFVDGTDRRAWYFGDDAQLPTLNPSPAAVSNDDLPLHRASQHFVAIASSATQVDLSWSDVGDDYMYYEVYRHTADDNNSAMRVGVPLAVNTRTYMDDMGLTTGTTYYYWLKACPAGMMVECSDFFAHTQATPKEPPVPQ